MYFFQSLCTNVKILAFILVHITCRGASSIPVYHVYQKKVREVESTRLYLLRAFSHQEGPLVDLLWSRQNV